MEPAAEALRRPSHPASFGYTKKIIFENCKFVNVQHNSKKLKLIFKNCTFTGNVSSANIELKNCRIEQTQKDAMNPLVNYKAKKCFCS